MRQFISNYKQFIKKPILEQIRIIANNFNSYHNVDVCRDNKHEPEPIVNQFHAELEQSSILYDADAQAEALGINKNSIKSRIERYRKQ